MSTALPRPRRVRPRLRRRAVLGSGTIAAGRVTTKVILKLRISYLLPKRAGRFTNTRLFLTDAHCVH
jgi:hypothetical protein